MPLFSLQHLLQEHCRTEEILKELETLLYELAVAPFPKESQRVAFARMMGLLNGDLTLHIRKEEQALFPALEAFLPSDTGPLAVLCGEHEALQANFHCLWKAGEPLWSEACPSEIAEKLRRFGRAAIQRLRDHIYKEDRILFPLVAQYLSEERDEEIVRRMEMIDCGEAACASPERHGRLWPAP